MRTTRRLRIGAVVVAALALRLGIWPAAAAAGLFGPFVDPLELPKKLFAAGRYQEVIAGLTPESIQRLRSRDLRRAYFLLGASHERGGKPAEALGIYQLGVKLFPGDINLLTQLAALLQRMGLEEQARPLFERVLQIHPNNAAAHLGLAEIDQVLGFLDRSSQHYEKALETMAEQAAVWRAYAEVLLAMRDYRTAELAVAKSLELSPEDPASHVALAFILRGSGRLAQALETLGLLQARHPARQDIALARGLWLLEAQRHEEAQAAAESVLESSPEEPLARFIRARARLKSSRPQDAVADLGAAAAGGRAAPFVAKAALALLSRLK